MPKRQIVKSPNCKIAKIETPKNKAHNPQDQQIPKDKLQDQTTNPKEKTKEKQKEA